MQNHKVRNLKGVPFFVLNKLDQAFYVSNMLYSVNLNLGGNTQEFYRHLDVSLPNVISLTNIANKAEIGSFFTQLNIDLDTLTMVFWSFEEPADLFILSDLVSHWSDIFHPLADDAWVLYIPSLGRTILFTHYGKIKFS